MITVSQYLSFIFSEITRARVIADTESVRIAEEYAKNPVMKHFSVPRFKIPEMELSIPMIVSGAQYDNAFMFVLPYADYLKNMQAYIARFGQMFAKPLSYEDPAMARVRAAVDELFKELAAMPTVQDINLIYKDKESDVNGHIDFIAKMLVSIYANQERVKPDGFIHGRVIRAITPEDLINQWKQTMIRLAKENVRLKESTLKNLLISPETNVVKTEGTDISIFSVKAKITEEGIFVSTVKTDGGQETKVVDFE